MTTTQSQRKLVTKYTALEPHCDMSACIRTVTDTADVLSTSCLALASAANLSISRCSSNTCCRRCKAARPATAATDTAANGASTPSNKPLAPVTCSNKTFPPVWIVSSRCIFLMMLASNFSKFFFSRSNCFWNAFASSWRILFLRSKFS